MKRLIPIILFLLSALLISGCAQSASDDGVGDTDSVISESESEITETEEYSDTEPQEKKLTIVCLGDSVTQGIFELAPGTADFFKGYVVEPESAYPFLLYNALIEKGINAEVINSGISGNYVSDGIKRLDRDVFAYNPDVVTVCFGLNDVCIEDVELYRSNLKKLFNMIRDYDSGIKIVFMTPNMLAARVADEVRGSYFNTVCAIGNVEITESGLLDTFMDCAREVCAEYDIPVCDAYAYWKNLYEQGEDITALLSSYCTHPSREMHKVFCDMLLDTFKENGITD